MCCPDQSSYELAHLASLLDGNRTLGGLRPRVPPKTRDGDGFALRVPLKPAMGAVSPYANPPRPRGGGGFALGVPLKPAMGAVSPYANPPRPRGGGGFAEGGSVVTLRDENCRA